MSYSEDLWQLVIQYVVGGGSKADAARMYYVCRSNVYTWLRDGVKKKSPLKTHRRKIDSATLVAAVVQSPDQTLTELGQAFGVHYSVISYALKRLNVTRKKTWQYFEIQNFIKIRKRYPTRHYQYSAAGKTFVCVDESGFAPTT